MFIKIRPSLIINIILFDFILRTIYFKTFKRIYRYSPSPRAATSVATNIG